MLEIKRMTNNRDALEPGTVINGYEIETIVGGGGFGVVYRARHMLLREFVAIKEYFPLELAVRRSGGVYPRDSAGLHFHEGLRRFVDEARILVRFRDDPTIVSCRDLFELNGTAYLVMEYVDGQPLSQVLRLREVRGQLLSEKELLALMIPLTESLERIHASVLHRDIKPSNILIRKAGGRPVLIDFGAAKQNAALQTKSLAPFSPGYAAPEQVGEGSLGPWTDVYGLGAVMWRIVAGTIGGKSPQPARAEAREYAVLQGRDDPLLKIRLHARRRPSRPPVRRMLKDDPRLMVQLNADGRFSPLVSAMIEKCLELDANVRIRDSSELLALLRIAASGQSVLSTEDSPFHEAARARHLRAIEVLCRVGWGTNDRGETLLHVASQADNLDEIKVLLEANANITARDRSGDTPMHAAAANGAAKAISTLVAAGADVDDTNNDRFTALHLAARKGQFTAITALLAAGADVLAGEGEHSTSLHLAAEAGQVTSINALVEAGARCDVVDDDSYSPLHLAAREGHVAAIKALVDWGSDGVSNDEEEAPLAPLVLAVQSGHLDAVKALLAAGFCADAGLGLEEPTPLHWASRRGDVAIVKVLLASGADVWRIDEEGDTPLHWAASAGQAEAIEALVAGGAAVWVKNRFSDATPLHLAAMYGPATAVEALLAAGADVSAYTRSGETPLDWAMHNKRTMPVLVAAGAKEGSIEDPFDRPI